MSHGIGGWSSRSADFLIKSKYLFVEFDYFADCSDSVIKKPSSSHFPILEKVITKLEIKLKQIRMWKLFWTDDLYSNHIATYFQHVQNVEFEGSIWNVCLTININSRTK